MRISDCVGYGFRGTRKDGRIFKGVVESVKSIGDRMLVIIKQSDNAYKSFYIDDITGGWSCSICNGQPV